MNSGSTNGSQFDNQGIISRKPPVRPFSIRLSCPGRNPVGLRKFSAINVAAVLLNCVHLDNSGNIGMLGTNISFVASSKSILVMKGIQDAGITSQEIDTNYFSPPQPSDEPGVYFSSMADLRYQDIDFCSTEQPSESLISFLSCKLEQDGKGTKRLNPGKSFCCDGAFPPSRSLLISWTAPFCQRRPQLGAGDEGGKD